ncbi:MAG: c-type cytochrome [Acidobacteria bacterium]|nr:c-type cytochrome [Acidobacteriota bacterium]
MSRRWMGSLLFVVAVVADPLFGQGADSYRGAEALRARGCTGCHSLLGQEGDGSAPDLGRPRGGVFSPAEFASALWNHSEAMWDAAARKDMARPTLDRQEARDIFAFLYSVRYFEPSGKPERGRAVFSEKGCYRCHALVKTDAGGIGPAVADWPLLDDPVRFLEAMWNHGSAMLQENELDGRPWPELNVRELSDLIAYIYAMPDLPPRRGRLQLGPPQAGMRLFDDLHCAECHTLLPGDKDLVPLLASPRRQMTLTELAVEMWNHRPIMDEWAEETGKEIPTLERGQMGQLLSYLFEEGFLEERGDPALGRKVFEGKSCARCHEAQPLPKREWRATDVVAGAWAHAPKMRERMRREGVAWPSLSAAELANLIAWLNGR